MKWWRTNSRKIKSIGVDKTLNVYCINSLYNNSTAKTFSYSSLSKVSKWIKRRVWFLYRWRNKFFTAPHTSVKGVNTVKAVCLRCYMMKIWRRTVWRHMYGGAQGSLWINNIRLHRATLNFVPLPVQRINIPVPVFVITPFKR